MKLAAPASRSPTNLPPPEAEGGVLELALLRERCSTCRACGLAGSRTTVVFGEGDPEAKVMFIGEGPGEGEDLSGRPFVGRAGLLLDKILESAGIDRSSVYITNIVKCRPPENRVPASEEAAACTPWLLRQIELISPQVIVTLGNVPAQFFLNSNQGISKLRGRWFSWRSGIEIFPMYHPAYLLRNPTREPGGPKAQTWDDIRALKRKLDGLGPKRTITSSSEPVQEGLF